MESSTRNRSGGCGLPRRNRSERRSTWSSLAGWLAISIFILGCDRQHQTAGSGPELYQLCAQCHGAEGIGNQAVNAPAIAGLEAWYVEAQLRKFKTGVRGTHPDDITGMQMRPMGISLRSDEEIKNVAAFVATLPAKPPAPTLTGGNAEDGATRYATCQLCHGQSAEGNLEKQAPRLTHTNDWYLLRQLSKFKSGVRAGNPNDAEGAQMVPWASALGDEQAMKDVVQYIQTLRGSKGS